MPRRSSIRVAKLSRPRLFGVVARTSLFERLDELSDSHRAIWIGALPGAGKTTLAASWLSARGLEGIWLQLDRGDADLATFFHYLAQAVQPWTRKHHRPLAALTPEYLSNVATYARRFFRALFLRLPNRSVVVLDNYQEAGDDPALHRILAEAIDEAPQGITVLFLGRQAPPEPFARHIANRTLALMGYSEMRLSLEDTESLVRLSELTLNRESLEQLHASANGWAAGLVLLLERLRRGESTVDIGTPEQLQEVFNYFAEEVLRVLPDAERRALMAFSFMPAITHKQADLLAGSPGAAQCLEQLHRRNVFTDRRQIGKEVCFQFHALFKAFLGHQAARNLTVFERRKLMRRSARLLEESEQPGEAFHLFCEAEDWKEASRLIGQQATYMLKAGRWSVLLTWLERLPAEVIDGDCWLLYWRGAAQIVIAPSRARAVLETACARAHGLDRMCEIQSAAGIVETYCVEWHRFSPMDLWLPVLWQAMDPSMEWPSADAELRALHALASVLVYRQPGNPMTDKCVARTFDAIAHAGDTNLRLLAACTLANHGAHNFRPEISSRARTIVEELIDDKAVTLANRGSALFSLSWVRSAYGDIESARVAAEETVRLGREEGLSYLLNFAGLIGTCLEGRLGNIQESAKWLAIVEEGFNPARWYDQVLLSAARAWHGVYSGHYAYSLAHGLQAVELSADGVVSSQIQWRLPLAVASAGSGDWGGARRRLGDIRQIAEHHNLDHYMVPILALEAYVALRSGNGEIADQRLKESLTLSRDLGFGKFYLASNIGPLMPLLCARALENATEIEEALALIRRFRWPVPQEAGQVARERWPWAVRVRMFGGFALEIDGAPLTFSGKTPRKPLALFKAIMCMGGDGVPVERLTDGLWPDQDGDSAHGAFSTTLYRLRELLGVAGAVLLTDGKVLIDRRLVWVDLYEMDALPRSEGEAPMSAQRALSLYAGPLLPAEDAAWILPVRQRARADFIRIVTRMGRVYEQSGRHEDALELYETALSAEPLAEALHQGKIRCHLGLGQHREASVAYRAFRKSLSREFGTPPSPETEALARAISG